MISPTVGRVVLYRPGPNDVYESRDGQPFAAIVAFVHDDRLVNLTVSHHSGVTYAAQEVPLIQDGDERPTDRGFAEWMAYQKGQAAKAEQLEKQLAVPGTPTAPTKVGTTIHASPAEYTLTPASAERPSEPAPGPNAPAPAPAAADQT